MNDLRLGRDSKRSYFGLSDVFDTWCGNESSLSGRYMFGTHSMKVSYHSERNNKYTKIPYSRADKEDIKSDEK